MTAMPKTTFARKASNKLKPLNYYVTNDGLTEESGCCLVHDNSARHKLLSDRFRKAVEAGRVRFLVCDCCDFGELIHYRLEVEDVVSAALASDCTSVEQT